MTERAVERLGIRTGLVAERPVPRTIVVGGTVTPRPGSSARLRAPMAGTVEPAYGQAALPLPGTTVNAGQTVLRLRPVVAPNRNLLAETQRDYDQAAARFRTAEKAAARARQLLADGAGDQAAVEVAEQNQTVAKAELAAAKETLRQAKRNPLGADVSLPLRAPQAGRVLELHAAAGQTVEPGALLAEVVSTSALWVRVPLYVGRIRQVDRRAPAEVRGLGREGPAASATPVPAMAVASAAGTVADLFYALEADSPFDPGHRVTVKLRLEGSTTPARVVPTTTVFYDHQGAAWVYAVVGPTEYERRRVEVETVIDGQAVLRKGPPVGTPVVRVGAMELYGTEFGIGK